MARASSGGANTMQGKYSNDIHIVEKTIRLISAVKNNLSHTTFL